MAIHCFLSMEEPREVSGKSREKFYNTAMQHSIDHFK